MGHPAFVAGVARNLKLVAHIPQRSANDEPRLRETPRRGSRFIVLEENARF